MVSIVYMVAGLSSRFKGKIKQFARITDNQTLIEYSLSQALPAGFDKIIFIVGEKTFVHFEQKFKDSYKGIPVKYAFQTFNQLTRDKPWGTVDALCSAMSLLKEPFVICNGDDIYGQQSFKILYDHLKNQENKKNKEDVTLGYILRNVLPEQGIVNRGIFKIKDNYVTNIEEVFGISKYNINEKNLTLEDLCSMNIFALHPETIEKLNNILINFKIEHYNNRTIECLLPIEISNLIQARKIKMRIYPTYDKWYGITNPGDEFVIRELIKKSESKNYNFFFI